jgi:putative ABC transport system permease protein
MGLTALGIAIGVGSLIGLVNLVHGVSASASSGLNGLGANVIFVSPSPQGLGRQPVKPISGEDVSMLARSLRDVDVVAPLRSLDGFARVCGGRRFVKVFGAIPDMQSLDGVTLASGRFISDLDVRDARAVAVIGAGLAEDLRCRRRGPSDAVVTVGGMPFVVIGEIPARGTRYGINRDDVVYVPLTALERLFGEKTRNAAGILVRVSQASQMSTTVGTIRRLLRRTHSLHRDEPDDFVVQSQGDLVNALGTLTTRLSGAVAAVVCISLIVAAIGIVNSLTTSVVERTAEVGLRRAVGATRRSIRLQFLAEAAVVSAVGTLGGAVLGAGATVVLGVWAGVPIVFAPSSAVFGGVIVCTLGLIAGVWPAIMASRIQPVVALHHE